MCSDIHFHAADLERICRTGDWIASLPSTYNISRAVICGDLLRERSSQQTSVLSACYRFLNALGRAVPHVNILLGNHDLAYRRDYRTTALEAMANDRLAPFATLHDRLGGHEWDGRRVFVMPYREDQGEIVDAVRALDPRAAAETVGFGHLAVNRAVTQMHVVDPATGESRADRRYPGFTGVAAFAPLARTFTGHFHNHQTILQPPRRQGQEASADGDLRGSLTYIGAPHQLTWADLYDEMKGVILLDPATLETEFVVNPEAVSYVTVDAQELLADRVPEEQVQGKYVMVIGRLSTYQYMDARDRLIKLGAKSVRERRPFEREWKSTAPELGQSVLPTDREKQPRRGTGEQAAEAMETIPPTSPDVADLAATTPPSPRAEQPGRKPINLGEMVRDYVASTELETELEDKQETLAVVGERLVQIGNLVRDKSNYEANYKDLLDLSTPFTVTPVHDTPHAATMQNIFEAEPRTLEITNFLGVQDTVRIDFQRDFQPGMNFIVGENGAGKSSIIEAITWCQFGQCIREGLGANDVVNDIVGRDCHVRLAFANGYAISRYRKHRRFQNRVVVERDGAAQPQFEGAHARDAQASLDALLGVGYDTFARTILLGGESTRSFLSASDKQRRQLIESALGLEILDACADACRAMLAQASEARRARESDRDKAAHTIAALRARVRDQTRPTLRRLRQGAQALLEELQRAEQKRARYLREKRGQADELRAALDAEMRLPDLEPELARLQAEAAKVDAEVRRLRNLSDLAQVRLFIARQGAAMQELIAATSSHLDQLTAEHERLLEDNATLEELRYPLVEEDTGEKEIGGTRGLVLRVTSALRKLWTSFLDLVTSRGEIKQLWRDHIRRISALGDSVAQTHGKVAEIAAKASSFIRDAARESSMAEHDVHHALRTLTVREAQGVQARLLGAIDEQQSLARRRDKQQQAHEKRQQNLQRRHLDLEKHEKEVDTQQRAWEAALERLELKVGGNEREIATCQEHVESDARALAELGSQAARLRREAQAVAADQAVFEFWQTSFARRRLAATRPTFRRHVSHRHRGELNKLLGSILKVMYRDTHYAQRLRSGTIGALFREVDEEDEEGENGEGGSGKGSSAVDEEEDNEVDDASGNETKRPDKTSVLDPSLSINAALEYAKKSGGERKRVDLALFFALFALGESRSAHVARYLLVDEAFDSLDRGGRLAVLKWCRWMTGRLAHVLVVTHNHDLVALARSEAEGDDGEGAGAANVVTVKAGDRGTEIHAGRDL